MKLERSIQTPVITICGSRKATADFRLVGAVSNRTSNEQCGGTPHLLSLSLNSIEAGRLLHNMMDQGLLLQNNKGRWTTYAISHKIGKSEERNGDVKASIGILYAGCQKVLLSLHTKTT